MSIRCTGIDPGIRSLAYCTLTWDCPLCSSETNPEGSSTNCSSSSSNSNEHIKSFLFETFWKYVKVAKAELINMYLDCEEKEPTNVTHTKPIKMIQMIKDVLIRRKDILFPKDDGDNKHYDKIIVRIEQQISQNTNMKAISYAICSTILYSSQDSMDAIESNESISIDFQSARQKLMVLTREDDQGPSKEQISTYKNRKNLSVSKCQESFKLLSNCPENQAFRTTISTQKKKDDVCDAFLHAIKAIQDEFYKHMKSCHKMKEQKKQSSKDKKPKSKQPKRKLKQDDDDEEEEDVSDSEIDLTVSESKSRTKKIKIG